MASHCWHDGGLAGGVQLQPDGRLRYGEMCCWCGCRRWKQFRPSPEHGSYQPSVCQGELFYEYEPGVVPEHCPRRPEQEKSNA